MRLTKFFGAGLLTLVVVNLYAQEEDIAAWLAKEWSQAVSTKLGAETANQTAGVTSDMLFKSGMVASSPVAVTDYGTRNVIAAQYLSDRADVKKKNFIDKVKEKMEMNKWLKAYQQARDGVDLARETVSLTRGVLQGIKNSEETAKRLWGDIKQFSDIEAYIAMYSVQMQQLNDQYRVNYDMVQGNASAYEAIVGKYRTNGMLDPLKMAKGYVDTKVTGQPWVEIARANYNYDRVRIQAWIQEAELLEMKAFRNENLSQRIVQMLNFRAMGSGGQAWQSYQNWNNALGRAESSIGFKSGLNNNYDRFGKQNARGLMFEAKDKYDQQLGNIMKKQLETAADPEKRGSLKTDQDYRNYAADLMREARQYRQWAAELRALAQQHPINVFSTSNLETQQMNLMINGSGRVLNAFGVR